MDLIRLGRILKAVRVQLGIRQEDLSARSGVSQAAISSAENGRSDGMALRDLERIARELGIRLRIDAWWPRGDISRLLDEEHASIVNYVVGVLGRHGWETVVEYGFNRYGERGAVDVLAWHAPSRVLLQIEVKSRFADLQEMLATFARKVRVVPSLVATSHGWRPVAIGRLVVAAGTTANRSVVARHANIFDVALPARSREARRWLRRPAGQLAALWFVSPGVTRDGTGRRPRQGSRVGGRRRSAASRPGAASRRGSASTGSLGGPEVVAYPPGGC